MSDWLFYYIFQTMLLYKSNVFHIFLLIMLLSTETLTEESNIF